MGSISNKTKDAAIAGDLLAQAQWLQDEITEYEDAFRAFTVARKAAGQLNEGSRDLEILESLRNDQALEAYDVYSCLFKFKHRLHYQMFANSLIQSMKEDSMNVSYVAELLWWLTDKAIDRHFPKWATKQEERGRTPLTQYDMRAVRHVLEAFGITILSEDVFELVQEIRDRVDDIHSEQVQSKLIQQVKAILEKRERGGTHE